MSVIVVHFEDLDEDEPRVQYLWDTLKKFSIEDRSRFLRFVTGRRRLPALLSVYPIMVWVTLLHPHRVFSPGKSILWHKLPSLLWQSFKYTNTNHCVFMHLFEVKQQSWFGGGNALKRDNKTICLSLSVCLSQGYSWHTTRVVHLFQHPLPPQLLQVSCFVTCSNLLYLPNYSRWVVWSPAPTSFTSPTTPGELFHQLLQPPLPPQLLQVSCLVTCSNILYLPNYSRCVVSSPAPTSFTSPTTPGELFGHLLQHPLPPQLLQVSCLVTCSNLLYLPNYSRWVVSSPAPTSFPSPTTPGELFRHLLQPPLPPQLLQVSCFVTCSNILYLPNYSRWVVSSTAPTSFTSPTTPGELLRHLLQHPLPPQLLQVSCFINCSNLLYLPNYSRWVVSSPAPTSFTSPTTPGELFRHLLQHPLPPQLLQVSCFVTCSNLLSLPNYSRWVVSSPAPTSFTSPTTPGELLRHLLQHPLPPQLLQVSCFINCSNLLYLPNYSRWVVSSPAPTSFTSPTTPGELFRHLLQHPLPPQLLQVSCFVTCSNILYLPRYSRWVVSSPAGTSFASPTTSGELSCLSIHGNSPQRLSVTPDCPLSPLPPAAGSHCLSTDVSLLLSFIVSIHDMPDVTVTPEPCHHTLGHLLFIVSIHDMSDITVTPEPCHHTLGPLLFIVSIHDTSDITVTPEPCHPTLGLLLFIFSIHDTSDITVTPEPCHHTLGKPDVICNSETCGYVPNSNEGNRQI